ncbi:MAG: hypothetical protein R3F24_08040 [Gammaproteobacteria bacterium]
MKKVLAAIALVGAAGVAQAAPVPATLVSVSIYSNNGSAAWTPTASDTSVWQLDEGTGVASIASGTYSRVVKVGATPLMTHTMTGVSIGGGAAASGSTWACTEGAFGGIVGASICGNYSFGGNFTNESTYTPTTTGATVTIGGDDVASGPPQTLNTSYDGMSTSAVAGAAAGFQRYLVSNHAGTSGYDFQFDVAVVPVPAAVWLFGSALGLLGVARRRMAA